MFNLRLKQVQSAMSDGQLDEAFRLVSGEEVKKHRKGQKLAAKLAKALAKRGKDHLAAQRPEQALSDCNKADTLGGNRAEVAELRRAICKRMEEKQYQHRQRNEKLAQAQQQMDNGWLSVGEGILEDVEHAEADILLQAASGKRKLTNDVVAKAEAALTRGNLEEAIEIIRRSGVSMNQDSRIAEQIGRIRETVVGRVKDYLNSGRVDLAGSMLGRLLSLDGDTVEVKQLGDAIAICGQAAESVAAGNTRQAVGLLGKLKIMLPGAKWIEDARSQAQKSAEAVESLCTGPLGLVSCGTKDEEPVEAVSVNEDIEESLAEADTSEGDVTTDMKKMVPSKFVLQIEGVGAYCVLREKNVSIGPISSSRRPTLGLMAQPGLPVVNIERHDEDYFLSSDERITIGEEMVSRKLLADGDKIALSPRCRMKFQMPNAASNTAILLLSSAKLARPDINHVILMDRDILIGSGVSNHVRTLNSNESLALFVRDGKMYCRTEDTIIVDGREYDAQGGLPIDKPIKIGRLGVVIVSESV